MNTDETDLNYLLLYSRPMDLIACLEKCGSPVFNNLLKMHGEKLMLRRPPFRKSKKLPPQSTVWGRRLLLGLTRVGGRGL